MYTAGAVGLLLYSNHEFRVLSIYIYTHPPVSINEGTLRVLVLSICWPYFKNKRFDPTNKNWMKSTRINQVMTSASTQFPRCFNRILCLQLQPEDGRGGGTNAAAAGRGRRNNSDVIRLIKSDGGIAVYDRPIKALDLMRQFPKHMVCRSDCFFIGQKTPALAAECRLQLGQSYFLLPALFFQTAVTFATFVRYRSMSPPGWPPFEVERTPSGTLRIKLAEEMIAWKREREEESVRVCSTPQLRRDYEQLVRLRRLWKPKLETIAEKEGRRREGKR